MNNFLKIIQKIWSSDTLMTIFSFVVRTGNFIFLLPLILKLDQAEQSVYWQFQFIYGFIYILVAELGLNFIRSLAFVQGGAKEEDLFDLRKKTGVNSSDKILELSQRVIGTIHKVGIFSAGVIFILLITLGSMALIQPISLISDQSSIWIAWLYFVAITSLVTFGGNYAHYIQGLGYVAIYRRWEAFVNIISIFAGIIALTKGYGLLGLIFFQQTVFALGLIGRRYLALNLLSKQKLKIKYSSFDYNIFLIIWSKTWRTTCGVIMHSGIFRLTPVFFAQLSSDAMLMASFGLTFKLMTTIVDLSKAPFYSKLPKLAKKFFSDFENAYLLIKNRFFLSLLLFSITVILIGAFGSKILLLLDSKTELCSELFWVCLGIGFFVERYSAMHLNIYTLSNHIIWHKMYFISGVLYIIFMSLFVNFLPESNKLYAFPISLFLSELFFSTWYSAKHSIKLLKSSFYDFEKKASCMPFIMILCYLFYVLYK